MNESSLMKGKFSLLVKQINEQKVQLEDKEKSAVSALITSWNKGEKTTLDYFDMKDHHHYLNHWCMQDYNGTVPTDIRELYKEYIQIGLKMRVKLLKLNVMLKAKSS
tara:strand:- start:384 stop:704 length:321 start_codon:yes stop_codon:yes gene_type:complete